MKKSKVHKANLERLLKRYNYQRDLTLELDRIGDRPFRPSDVDRIVLWKVNRYVKLGSKTRKALNCAVDLKPGLHRKARDVLLALLQERGVDLPMASTLLRFRNPKTFQVIDRRAYRAVYDVAYPLKRTTGDEEKLEVYFDYLDELVKLAKASKFPFENLDRALYVLDKELKNKL